jgi:hypothetical protein
VFAISTIPIQGYDIGRIIPPWLDLTSLLLVACMLPFCALVPIPLLIAGRRHLRRSAVRTPWRTTWDAAASASIAVEVIFLIELAHALTTPYPNLRYMAWHALEFSACFLVTSVAMTVALSAARRSSRHSRAIG